jgi:hypothetical protein
MLTLKEFHSMIASFGRVHNLMVQGKSKEEKEKMNKPFSLGSNSYPMDSRLNIWKIAQTTWENLTIDQREALGEYVVVKEKKLLEQKKLYDQRMDKLNSLLSILDKPDDLYTPEVEQ